MMEAQEAHFHVQTLDRFVAEVGGGIIESTAYAKTSSAPSPLYNVRGSTPDPYPPNVSGWKALLQSQGFGAPCYATSPLPVPPKGPSHPGFDVGGHMTTDPNGAVAKGGSCYLMPLCAWHNNSNNKAAFATRSNSMLVLYGYMQADTAATFLARLDGTAPYALIYLAADGPAFQALETPVVAESFAASETALASDGMPRHFVLLRREERDGRPVYRIEDSRTE